MTTFKQLIHTHGLELAQRISQSTLEQCRDRISALAETRAMAVRDPNNADSGDDLLTAIYEAERGLNSSIRLVQRAAKQGRL